MFMLLVLSFAERATSLAYVQIESVEKQQSESHEWVVNVLD